MSVKIAMIGSGSAVFTLNVVRDILTYPALQNSEIHFMDIDKEKLALVEKLVNRIIRQGRYDKVRPFFTTNRQQAITNANFVVNTAYIGTYQSMVKDFAIMNKYGISQCIGDTLGPDAVFRAQRAIPFVVDIANETKTMAAKNAWLINYSNPMAMLTWAAIKATGVKAVGLCHGVHQTLERLSDFLGIDMHETSHLVAGTNHQSWILELKHKGKDLLPQLEELSENPTVYRKDIVRWELYRQLGYFCTESSGHDSEYNPWFRKRPDIEAQYCSGFGFSGERNFHLRHYNPDNRASLMQMEMLANGEGHLSLLRSPEYCAGIINAITTGEKYNFYGNLLNERLITNLPSGCCVEVPCVADAKGVTPKKVGDLPPQLAALNKMQITSQEFAVRAALELDQELVFNALCYDPLTSAVLSLQEIRDMTSELFQVTPEYLPPYRKHLKVRKAVIKFDYAKYKKMQAMPKAERFKEENLFSQYFLAGPFSSAGENGPKGLRMVQAPENGIDLLEPMEDIVTHRLIKWKPIDHSNLEENGSVDLLKNVGIEPDSVCYAVTALSSKNHHKVRLLVGSDEGNAIWLNGQLVHFHEIGRPIDKDQDTIDITLSQGVNVLLFKISQSIGYWGLIARLEQKPEDIKYLSLSEINKFFSQKKILIAAEKQ
jgi:alpha-galactosidase